MKKNLLILIAVGLLCWAGQASAVSITLDNGIARFTIDDGVVKDAVYLSDGPDRLNAFTFVVVYDSPAGTQYVNALGGGMSYEASSHWVDPIGAMNPNHRFSKTLVTASGVSASLGVSYTLLPGKEYLDVRYSIYVSSGAGITNLRTYIIMEPIVDSSLSGYMVARPSGLPLVDDPRSNWYGGPNWPNPNMILFGNCIKFGARVPDDDFMSASKAAVDALVYAGLSLPNTIVQPLPGEQGALAMRVPTSPAVIAVPGGTGWYVESRLEVQAVPEPCTIGLVLAGLAGLGAKFRRRNRKV